MALRESDIEVWAMPGGFVIAFDRMDGEEGATTHVCTTERELVTLLLNRLDTVRDPKASDAAERALRGK